MERDLEKMQVNLITSNVTSGRHGNFSFSKQIKETCLTKDPQADKASKASMPFELPFASARGLYCSRCEGKIS